MGIGAKLRGLNRCASRRYSKGDEKIIYLCCNRYTEITAGLKNGPAVIYPHHCQNIDMLQHGISQHQGEDDQIKDSTT